MPSPTLSFHASKRQHLTPSTSTSTYLGLFFRLETEFAGHYFDAEIYASFSQAFKKPKSKQKETSAVENYQFIMENAQAHHKIVEVSSYYFSFLLLSQSNACLSSLTLNELIEESANNFSSASIRSFVELFEGKSLMKFQSSAKILFFPKDKVFIPSQPQN